MHDLSWKRTLAILALLSAPGCYLSHGLSSDAGVARDGDAPVDAGVSGPLVWVLIHPSDAPMGTGLYLFDEGSQTVVRRLPLPDGATSPNALAWDGRSLWLGGIDEEPAVRELDPTDGRVRSRWPGVVTEGLTVDGETLWYSTARATFQDLEHVTRDGTMLATRMLDVTSVQDLVSIDGVLYYLVNDDVDRIVRVDPDTGAATDVVRGVHPAPYSLGFDGTYLAVAVDGRILRFDPATGALARESAFAVPGWITAIAFVR